MERRVSHQIYRVIATRLPCSEHDWRHSTVLWGTGKCIPFRIQGYRIWKSGYPNCELYRGLVVWAAAAWLGFAVCRGVLKSIRELGA